MTGPSADLDAARHGDAGAFERLVAPHRRELAAHCYRMLGSISDADDTLQEALIGAWRGISRFEARSSLRAWLYRIATNACLDLLATRPQRSLPHERGVPPQQAGVLEPPVADPIWIEPAPDAIWQSTPAGPESVVSAKESVGIAFMTAIQRLPATQRAVLLLRDVLGFSSAETAELLDTTIASVNSALQRARATLGERRIELEQQTLARSEGEARSLLSRYVAAWERGTSDDLIALLREDAVFTMPPIPSWFRGARPIAQLIARIRADAEIRCIVAHAAGGLGVAVYTRAAGEPLWQPTALHTLLYDRDKIAEIHAFLAPESFARFDLPATPATA